MSGRSDRVVVVRQRNILNQGRWKSLKETIKRCFPEMKKTILNPAICINRFLHTNKSLKMIYLRHLMSLQGKVAGPAIVQASRFDQGGVEWNP